MDPSPTRYVFRDFVLEPAERRLSRAGVAVELPSKIFDVLCLLVGRAGHLVAKDDFHAVLWPRQVVSEATLNKYVWQLRRALGEGDDDARFIETVPRQGYRFVAAVEVDESAIVRGEPAPPTPLAASRTQAPVRFTWGGVALCLALAGLAAWSLDARREPRVEAAQGSAVAVSLPDAARPVIAVAPADVLDGLPPWLGTAMSEVLSRELAVSEQVRIVPQREAARDFPELARRAGTTMHREDLARWRSLGADAVLAVVVQRAAGGEPRDIELRFRLHDAANGHVSDELRVAGSEDDLDRLVAVTGERVRSALGVNPLSDSLARTRHAHMPRDAETARLYSLAVEALTAGMQQVAVDRLGEVVQHDPAFVAAWLELARAELEQGHAARAARSARAGLSHAASAPRELRLSLEAVQFEAGGAWRQAVETWQALYRFFPDQPEYGLRLVHALLSADDKASATQALAQLKERPGLADDANVLIAEFQLARGMDDWVRAREVASRLVARAGFVQSEALRARALALRGQASIELRDAAAAAKDLEEARMAFVEAADRNGMARTELLLGNLRMLGGDLAAAEVHYHAAVDGYRAVGARANENVALDNLLAIAVARGDPASARRPVEELLASARALGETLAEARALVYLAWVELDAGHSDAALGAYREAAELNARAGNRAQQVASLAYMAALLATTGQSRLADDAAARSLSVSAAIDDARYRIVALKAVADVAQSRHDLASARAAYAEARAIAAQRDDRLGIARIDLALAGLDLEQGDAAQALARMADAESALADSVRDLVKLAALRARALGAEHRMPEARVALAASRGFAEKTTGYLDRLPFRLAEVDVLAMDGAAEQAQRLAAPLRTELAARRFSRDLAELDASLAQVARR